MFELALAITVLECVGLVALADKISKGKNETVKICEW